MSSISNINILNKFPILANESKSFSDFRIDNFRYYNLTHFPTEFSNNWKYSNVDKLSLIEELDSQFKTSNEFKSKYLDKHISDSIYLDVNANNNKISHKELYLDTLTCAFSSKSELIESINNRFISQMDNDLIDKTYFYNQAFCNSGCLLEIDKNAEIKPTIIIYNEITSSVNSLNFIKVNANSVAKVIIVNYSSNDKNICAFTTNKIVMENNARLYLAEINLMQEQTCFVAKTLVNQDKNSSLEYLNFSIGSLQTKSDIMTNLDTGSNICIYGSAFGNNNDNLSFNNIINHNSPHTTSDILYNIALDGSAQSFYQGNIKVGADANQTLANQKNKNLLLNQNCHAESLPKLEILANDVHCSHGATVGKLDQNQLFYLQSYGLDKNTAQRLIIEGFLRQVFKKYSQTQMYELLKDFIDEELNI